jgi:hypothetical protein
LCILAIGALLSPARATLVLSPGATVSTNGSVNPGGTVV